MDLVNSLTLLQGSSRKVYFHRNFSFTEDIVPASLHASETKVTHSKATYIMHDYTKKRAHLTYFSKYYHSPGL